MWLDYVTTRADVSIAGCVDVDRTRADEMKARFGLDAYVGSDLDTALHSCSPNLVINTTIPQAHTAVTIAALEAGCDVLVEKPLAATAAEARQVIQAAERTGRSCSVMQNRRYGAAIRSVRTVI